MRRYGIEVELIGLNARQAAAALTAAGIDCRAPGYTHAVMRTWKAVTDATVAGGCEVVSPPLSGEEGLEQIRTAMDALNAAGARINRSCGLHVHIEARDLNTAEIANTCIRYARHEADIDAIMPRSRRGNDNRYCASLRRASFTGSTVAAMIRQMPQRRYHKVNLEAYIKYGTIEFRQHSGTTEPTKIINWVRFLQAFIEESRATASQTVATSDPVDINMDGLSRTERTILEHIRSAMHPTDDLLGRMAGIQPHSARAAIHRLRRRGFGIVCRRGLYRLTGTPAPTANAGPDRGLWNGVPTEVVDYYAARRAHFATAA